MDPVILRKINHPHIPEEDLLRIWSEAHHAFFFEDEKLEDAFHKAILKTELARGGKLPT